MGSNTSKQSAQVDLNNQLQQQALAKQSAITDANTAALTPYLTGNRGFTPQQLSALTSSALDQNALRYADAARTTNANLAARGESGLSPISGVAAGTYAGLQSARAGDLADALRTITLNNAQQGQANMFNAASVLSGGAQTYAGNAANAGSGASSALGAYTQAQGNGLLSQFTRGLGSGLGTGVAAGVTGGLGNAFSKLGWGR